MDVEALYVRYGAMVRRRCLSLLKNAALAEDAMQDVFVRLLNYRQPLHDEALTGLLFRMATQVSLNRLRTIKRHPENAEDEVLLRIAHADDLEERRIGADLVARLFGAEPESTRTLATLHFVDGLTLEEVAREAGMSVSGVRKRLRGLKERLAQREEGSHDGA